MLLMYISELLICLNLFDVKEIEEVVCETPNEGLTDMWKKNNYAIFWLLFYVITI